MGKKKKGKPETDEPIEGEGEGLGIVPPHPGGVPEFSDEQMQFAPFDESTSSGGSDSSTSTSSDYGLKMDHTSGQDMAASLSQALLDEQSSEMEKLMGGDPIGAIASGDRIRQLSRMIQAYKGGYDLADLEIIPHSRVAAEDFGSRTTFQSSSSGKSNRGTGHKQVGRQIRENMD